MTTWPLAPRSLTLSAGALSALAGVMLAAFPAAAQSPKIEDVCVQVAKHFLMTETVHTGVVQAFPDLKPPGARLTYFAIGATIGAISWFYVMKKSELLDAVNTGSLRRRGSLWYGIGRYVYVPMAVILCFVALFMKIAF